MYYPGAVLEARSLAAFKMDFEVPLVAAIDD